MPIRSNIDRRSFLSLLGVLVPVAFLYLWYKVISRQNEIAENGEIWKIKSPILPGVTIYEDFYIYSDGKKIRAYSTTCTHAGCRLQKVIGNEIICSCHGSRFDITNGKVIKGPAIDPLRNLQSRFDSKNEVWIITNKH